MKHKLLPPAAFLLLLITSCKKEGEQHSAGKNDDAPVVTSNTIVLNDWSSRYDDGTDFLYSGTIPWSAITQEKDRSVVMVYYHDRTTTGWKALPSSEAGNGYSHSMSTDLAPGAVHISYEGYDNAGSRGASSLNGLFTVRLVTIPVASRMANPKLDLGDYNAVKKAFHLKD